LPVRKLFDLEQLQWREPRRDPGRTHRQPGAVPLRLRPARFACPAIGIRPGV